MADKTLSERLQPSLLDRLTDDDPTNPAEPRDARVIDIRRLREIVQRDLSWLLNTSSAEVWIDPDRHPHAARSVLNYGVRDVGGRFFHQGPGRADPQGHRRRHRAVLSPGSGAARPWSRCGPGT